jgi:hypothetical protein
MRLNQLHIFDYDLFLLRYLCLFIPDDLIDVYQNNLDGYCGPCLRKLKRIFESML